MNDTGAKQQIVDKIKDSSNILVTVSRNPSVDELSAALGLTVLLNKMKKHATAVFSGAIPPAITFLDPEKTFEATVDSLRDFIIALDKEKADHLRYKVEGDVVKIFITPYRTTITGDDLEFSQGDYNVELVLGLGVQSQDDLDEALAAHGRILHDATVATMTVGDMRSQLGSVDWHEQNASSLSEMLVSLTDSLKSDKALLDEQIATAFLTGIVAATDRFSNSLTSSKAMTVAGQLMTAGANQQLIASKLEEAHEIGSSAGNNNSDGTTDLAEGQSTKLLRNKPAKKNEAKKPKPADDGSLTISHEKQGDLDEVAAETASDEQTAAAKRAEEELAKQAEKVPKELESEAAKAAEQNLAQQLNKVAPAAAATPSLADLQKDIAAASEEVDDAAVQPPASAPAIGPAEVNNAPKDKTIEPSFGGTLNATTEQAAEDKRKEVQNDQNHTILTHGGNSYVGDSSPTFQSPLNAAAQSEYEPPVVDPFSQASPGAPAPVPNPTPVPQAPAAEPETTPVSYAPPIQPPNETLADLDAKTRAPQHEEARAAVDAAFSAAPQAPMPQPEAMIPPSQSAETGSAALPPLPPMPDFSTLPPLPPAPGGAAPAPSQPSGALPPEKLEEVLGAPAPSQPAPQSNDPGQFKIPGQS
ncbi:MAG TPA: hypothetical protein VFH06_00640 [Candidatus Saccharimonadales bacterium]|nr:hypothetical protein [Candidatus Saccharimonadales bacterium]